MVGNHRTIYNESLIYLSLKLNPFFEKSEPILQFEPIRILYPIHQLLSEKDSGLYTILSLFQLNPPFLVG